MKHQKKQVSKIKVCKKKKKIEKKEKNRQIANSGSPEDVTNKPNSGWKM